eukprot:1157978-Pelagomonas_calceolata.AAC.5
MAQLRVEQKEQEGYGRGPLGTQNMQAHANLLHYLSAFSTAGTTVVPPNRLWGEWITRDQCRV